ncbi:MAG: hypothetical protein IJ523_05210 [Succinivibrionaceae bacterium]|nr:hypothetical protein [Succinivibrionaceae bacterium]
MSKSGLSASSEIFGKPIWETVWLETLFVRRCRQHRPAWSWSPLSSLLLSYRYHHYRRHKALYAQFPICEGAVATTIIATVAAITTAAVATNIIISGLSSCLFLEIVCMRLANLSCAIG